MSVGKSFYWLVGCTTGAADLQTLFRKAAEVLPFHVEGMLGHGLEIPLVRTLDELRQDPMFREDADDAVLVGVVNVDLPGRAVRVNITVEESLLARIDRAAEAARETRSGFLAEAARQRIAASGGALERGPGSKGHRESADQSPAGSRTVVRIRTDAQSARRSKRPVGG